jgi:hypothetical protein
MESLIKKFPVLIIVLFLSLPAQGGNLFSVQVGSYKSYRKAYSFFNRLPDTVRAFLYKTGEYYTVRIGLFAEKGRAIQKKANLKETLNLDGYVVKVNPEKLLYLFRDEDYEEFLSLFSSINIRELPLSVVYAIGVSYSKTGKVREAEKVLSIALKRGEKKAVPILIKLYYAESNYKKLISLYESSDKKLPDSTLYYVALSYLKAGKEKKLRKVINAIKDEEIKFRIFRKKTTVKTDLRYGYDSNIYLVPEDVPLGKRGRKDRYREVSVSVINSNIFGSYSFSILGKRFDNRDNSDLDIAVLTLERTARFSGFDVVLPSVSYVYTMNSNYSFTLKSGIRRKFSSLFLSLLAGYERNFINRDKDNLQIETLLSAGGFNFFFFYKNYSDENDKVFVTLSKNLKLAIAENLNLVISPKVKFAKYMNSTRSVRPEIAGKLSLKVSKRGEVYLRGGYERNYAHDEGMEWDYKKRFVEFGVKCGF